MAIEKLQHGYNEGDRSSSGPSGTDIINKINEIIDYINSEDPIVEKDEKGEKETTRKKRIILLLLACSSVLLAGCTYKENYGDGKYCSRTVGYSWSSGVWKKLECRFNCTE